jgi:hypothetical protein
MIDPLEELAKDGTDHAKERFFQLCRKRLVPQLRQRIVRRGLAPVLDGQLEKALASDLSDTLLDQLWGIVVAVAGRPEVAFTLGVVQGILAYVLAAAPEFEEIALDRAIESKVIPHLQGSVSILSPLDAALKPPLVRSKAAIAALRAYAEENGDIVAPMY